jgi:hypothetical protein
MKAVKDELGVVMKAVKNEIELINIRLIPPKFDRVYSSVYLFDLLGFVELVCY